MTGVNLVGESIEGELMAIVNYAIIGIIDTLADSYRSRREELALFLVAGMSRKQKRRMIYAENLCVLLFVLLLSVPCILLSVSFIRQGLFTFGTDLLYFFMR